MVAHSQQRLLSIAACALLAWGSSACSGSGAGAGGQVNPPAGVDTQGALIDLGFELFFDERLSRPTGVACGTCHDPNLGWGDSRPQGKGIQDNTLDMGGHNASVAVAGTRFKTILTPRNTPTIYNAHLFTNLFWDGRALALHHQSQFPFEAGPEMNSSWEEHILPLLRSDAGYEALFSLAYGPGQEQITRANAAAAIGAYEETVSVFDTPYDAFLAGDVDALTPQQRQGHDLFFGKADCGRCHPAPFLTDFSFHNTGVPAAGVHVLNGVIDLGFGGRTDLELLPDGEGVQHDDQEDYCKFKTPQLRMVGVTGPYMHDGALLSLDAVVDFYNQGGGPDLSEQLLGQGNGTKDNQLAPLGLSSDEKSALLAFLGDALTGTEIR